jgi:heat shock protein HslJ
MTPYRPRYKQALAFACLPVFSLLGCAANNDAAHVATSATQAVASKSDASLINTYWKLLEIEGKPAALGAGGKEIHLITGGEENHVHGFSGCNRFSGGYKQNDDRLEFGNLATTRMACADSMELESSFLDALNRVRRYSIQGERLTLYDEQNQSILLFEAVYLK